MPQHNISEIPEQGTTVIRTVRTFRDLFNGDITPPFKAVILQRQLQGDFDGLAFRLAQHMKGKHKAGASDLALFHVRQASREIALAASQRLAISLIAGDMASVQRHKYCDVKLRIIGHDYYKQDPEIWDFHHDGNKHRDTHLERLCCCYNQYATEFLMDEDVKDTIVYPNGLTGDASLAYTAVDSATILRPGLGDMWRHACCTRLRPKAGLLHRAPRHDQALPPRLMLVADIA